MMSTSRVVGDADKTRWAWTLVYGWEARKCVPWLPCEWPEGKAASEGATWKRGILGQEEAWSGRHFLSLLGLRDPPSAVWEGLEQSCERWGEGGSQGAAATVEAVPFNSSGWCRSHPLPVTADCWYNAEVPTSQIHLEAFIPAWWSLRTG